ALRAEPPAVVRRLVQIDVAAAFIGADAEAGTAVLAQPDRQAPDRAGQVFRAHRCAAAGEGHVPVAGVMTGDAWLHWEGLEQGVQLGDRVGVASRGAVLEDL